MSLNGNPEFQKVKIGCREIREEFGVGQFINDFGLPSITEANFQTALDALKEYGTKSLKRANCELAGNHFWFEASKDIEPGK